MVAVRLTSVIGEPTSSDASNSSKRPRTFESPRWRTTKKTPEWFLSRAQRPGARGRAEVVVLMDRTMGPPPAVRKAGSTLVPAGPG